MSRQRIMSNILMMGMGQVCTWSLSLVYFVALGRYLGPNRFGELALAKAVVAVLWLGSTLGMEILITRSVARAPERTGILTSAAIIARTALAIPVFAILFLYTHAAHYAPEVRTAAYVFGAAEILWSAEKVFLAAFQGREHMSLNLIWTFARRTLTLGLALVVIRLHGGVVAFAVTEIPIALVLFVVTVRWMQRFGRLTWHVPVQELLKVVTGGLAFWANEVFFTFYLYIDAVILAGLAGTRAVGIYTPATQMFSVAMFLTGILGPATLPQLSRLGVGRGEEFKQAARKVLLLFIVAGVPITICMATFAEPLLVSVFGPSYRSSAPVLVVLSVTILPMFLNFQFSQTLAASDRQWWWATALAGACVVNPLLNLFCVPFAQHAWHNAAIGAALAWLITELLEVVYGAILLADIVWNKNLARSAGAAAAAGVAQTVVLWVVGTVWLPLGETLGLVAFVAVALALRAIPPDDVTFLRQVVVQRVRGSTIRVHVAGAE